MNRKYCLTRRNRMSAATTNIFRNPKMEPIQDPKMFNFILNHCFVNQISGVPIFGEPQNSRFSLSSLCVFLIWNQETERKKKKGICHKSFSNNRKSFHQFWWQTNFSFWNFNAVMLGWIGNTHGNNKHRNWTKNECLSGRQQLKKGKTELNCRRTTVGEL